MFGIIDRFEGELVIVELEDSSIINIRKEDVPKEAKEGDVLNIKENITINYEETTKRKKKMQEMTKDIWE